MNRRDFLSRTAMTVPVFSTGLRSLVSEPASALKWRTYDVTTTVNILKPAGRTMVWLPLPLRKDTNFQRTLSHHARCDTGRISFHEVPATCMKMLIAEFPAGRPVALTTTHRVSTRDWSVSVRDSFASSKAFLPRDAAEFVKGTHYVPTDGIVKTKADEITRGITTDVEKTHAIYTWIVENTYRDAKVRGCGVGDIRPMLETGDLGGKCADLNALFVGLVKASGIPARDAYGIRIGPSALECKSLGTSSSRVEKAQHCRSEVFLTDFGWVPMDPADVRKVILEEPPGNLGRSDPKVKAAEHRLFGSWEMNWMAYNYAQDVTLPGSNGKLLPFFMYPQAETEDGRLDSLDPAAFHYEITSQELVS